jgi:hypothetical protein
MIVQYRVYAEGGIYALSLVRRMNEWINEWIVRMNGTACYALRSQGKRARVNEWLRKGANKRLQTLARSNF